VCAFGSNAWVGEGWVGGVGGGGLTASQCRLHLDLLVFFPSLACTRSAHPLEGSRQARVRASRPSPWYSRFRGLLLIGVSVLIRLRTRAHSAVQRQICACGSRAHVEGFGLQRAQRCWRAMRVEQTL
jgi:hypothetical protein